MRIVTIVIQNSPYRENHKAWHALRFAGAATGNPYMAEIASEFRRRTGPFRAKKFATREDLMASALSHNELIASIFSEDSNAASDGMRAHMAQSFKATLAAN